MSEPSTVTDVFVETYGEVSTIETGGGQQRIIFR